MHPVYGKGRNVQSQATILWTKHVTRIFSLSFVVYGKHADTSTGTNFTTMFNKWQQHHHPPQHAAIWMLPTVCWKVSRALLLLMAYYSTITTTTPIILHNHLQWKSHKPDRHPYLSQMTASYYVNRQMLACPPLLLHKHTVSCYSKWLRQVLMIHYLPA